MTTTNSQQVTDNILSPHSIATSDHVLLDITQPEINLGLWQRPIQPAIAKEVSVLLPGDLPDMRYRTSSKTFSRDINTALQEQGLNPASFTRWRHDLRRLAERFFSLGHHREVRFRLVTTAGDECSRFHVDTRCLRLLCTYRGPGTQWLDNAQVDRAALARAAPNAAIIRFGTPARFESFWVGILKGDIHGTRNGLVHRSPPLVGTGQTRVLFCLDAEP